MISDWELWACAQQLLDTHGPAADRQIEARVTALAEAGDRDGIATWFAIADRVDLLRDETGPRQARH